MLSRAEYRRTSSQAGHDKSERWLLTYADLITLLLAFFVVMYGVSSADAKKFSKVAGSMRKAFNAGVLPGEAGSSILDQSTAASVGVAGADEDVAGAQARDLDLIYQEMGWISQQDGLADRVTFSLQSEGVAISISGNLLFASGRAELRPDAVRLLQSLGRVLSQLPNNVAVEGHTDDIAPNGTAYASNWELSGARAIAVVRYLAEVEKIDPRRLSAAAYSEYQPAAPNDSARSRARNRRSKILILYPRSPGQAIPEPSHDGAPTLELELEEMGAASRR